MNENWKFQLGEMSQQEKEMIMMLLPKYNVALDDGWIEGVEHRKGANGVTYCDVTQYARDKGLVDDYIKAAYPFTPVPNLDDTLLDIHSGKTFKLKDCRFILYADRVMAVSPEFYTSGGTVLDWVAPNEDDGCYTREIKAM